MTQNRAALFVASLVAVAANQQTLDCPLRQVGLDYAQKLQPWRSVASFQEVADALNGAVEAVNCSVAPTANKESTSSSRVLSYALPPMGSAAGPVFFVDPSPAKGSDISGDGSEKYPFLTLQHALQAVRASRSAAGVPHARMAPQATLVLRAGTFYLGSTGTLLMTPEDSRVTMQAYPDEPVFISGGTPLNGLTWTAVTPPPRAAYEYRPGTLSDGFDIAPAGEYTIEQAQALCNSLPKCLGFSFSGSGPNPTGAVPCAFKYNVFWSASGTNVGVYVKNVGYVPGAQPALYSAPVTQFADITALRASGVRMIRARYPNVPTVELQGAMQVDANGWTQQPMGTNANYTFQPAFPSRNDSAQGYFQNFKLGIGGPCAFRFTPQASYWCADDSQGGTYFTMLFTPCTICCYECVWHIYVMIIFIIYICAHCFNS
jgi:hypothetical protein